MFFFNIEAISLGLAEFDPKFVSKIIEMSRQEPKHPVDVDGSRLASGSRAIVAPFNCPPFNPSSSKPTNVNELRPGDIEVVAAIGDSLTVKIDFFDFS